MEMLLHRFEFVMFNPHNCKQVVCVEQNELPSTLNSYTLKDPSKEESKSEGGEEEDKFNFLFAKPKEQKLRASVARKKEFATSPRGKDVPEDIAGKLAGLATKKDHEGRRPSNLIIPEGQEYNEEQRDIEFGEPTKLELRKNPEPENRYENTTVAVSVWDASSVTPIQINEVELDGTVDNPRLSFSDDGKYLLFPYKSKEGANVVAIILFDSLKLEQKITFDKNGEEMERIFLRMPHSDLINVGFRQSYDDTFEHFIIQRDGEQWVTVKFEGMEEN